MKSAVAGLAVAFVGLLAGGAAAECCEQCGCCCQPSKVCRLVPDKKKVPKITYSCQCEDFCVPGPSKICGYKCECEDDCTCGGHLHRTPIWQPTCAEVHTRSKLVKMEEMKEVCGWKWVVEDLCPSCAANAKRVKQPTEEALVSEDPRDDAEEMIPIVAPTTIEDARAPETKLVSHSLSSRIKRRLAPMLTK